MRQVELDTIDVITFLKTQDTKKNAAVSLIHWYKSHFDIFYSAAYVMVISVTPHKIT